MIVFLEIVGEIALGTFVGVSLAFLLLMCICWILSWARDWIKPCQ